MVAAHEIHPGIGQGKKFPAAGVHHKIGPGGFLLRRSLLRTFHGDNGQPLAEPYALPRPKLRLGEGGQLPAGPVQKHQGAGAVHRESPVLGEGEGLPVLHGDRQHAAGVHIAEAAAAEAGGSASGALHPVPGQGDGGHAVAEGAHGGVIGLQQHAAVRAVKAVQSILPHGIGLLLAVVGDDLVHPQADQLLNRRVGGRSEAQTQQSGQCQGKQFFSHSDDPFQRGFIRQAVCSGRSLSIPSQFYPMAENIARVPAHS